MEFRRQATAKRLETLRRQSPTQKRRGISPRETVSRQRLATQKMKERAMLESMKVASARKAKRRKLSAEESRRQLAERKKQLDVAKDLQRQDEIEKLMRWLKSHHCSKKCGLELKLWDNITHNHCKTDCVDSIERLRKASDAIHPGDEHMIEFPMTNSSKITLHQSNDKTEYNAMMFAGGVKLNGKTSFVARLCTHGCAVGQKYYDSTMILGELEKNDTTEREGASWHWKDAAEHWVSHHDGYMAKGDYVGPEDPRMDVLEGKRFLTLSMNVPAEQEGCGENNQVGIRHMFFVPLDDTHNYKTCDITIPEIDRCKVQKNWTPLVPRGSKDVYYMYSIRPLVVMRFRPKSCKASWVDLPMNAGQEGGNIHFRGTGVHGGTRYVFGKQVDEGDLFFSIGHTPGPDYNAVVVALLVRNEMATDGDRRIELVGISCPLYISKKYGDIVARGGQPAEDLFFLTTSIVDFEPKADTTTITFQAHDRENYRSELFGIGSWLHSAYKEFKSGNVFSCDQLH